MLRSDIRADIRAILPNYDMSQHRLLLRLGGTHFGVSNLNCSFNNSQTWLTCFSVVRILPMESRKAILSFNLVCESKAFPVALTPCMIASFKTSSRASRAAGSAFSRAGQARKQTSVNGSGAINSQSLLASIHEAKSFANRQCSRMRA